MLGLGLWGNGGGCGPALASRPPSSLSGSAFPLPDQPLDTGQAPGLPATQLCAFPHRRTPLACSTPSDSLLPWPLATAVSWQEVGTRLYRSHSLVCKGLRARRSEAVDGQHTAAGPGTARPVAGSAGPVGAVSRPPLAFGSFLSSSHHEEVVTPSSQPLVERRPGLEGSGHGPLGHSPLHLARHEGCWQRRVEPDVEVLHLREDPQVPGA